MFDMRNNLGTVHLNKDMILFNNQEDDPLKIITYPN